MNNPLTPEQWHNYQTNGYVGLGRVLSDKDLNVLQNEIDDIMMGRALLDYDRLLMQLDPGIENGSDTQFDQTRGHKGATLSYRKIQDLEYDPQFLSYIQRPLFRSLCRHIYGPDTPIACYRAMFMNKPARKGTPLSWHQDRWTHLDRDPLMTVWTALDCSTKENGCLRVAAGAHHSLINPSHPSGYLTDQQCKELTEKIAVIDLEMEAGEAVLLHNRLPHSSGINNTDLPRRAFSVCYMAAVTRLVRDEDIPKSLLLDQESVFPVLFGAEGA